MLRVTQQVEAAKQSDLVGSGLRHNLNCTVSHVSVAAASAVAVSR